MAFFKKNVQNNLQDYGFMPIFAPNFAALCAKHDGKNVNRRKEKKIKYLVFNHLLIYLQHEKKIHQ